MRHTEAGPVLTVRATAGLHVVIVAWDFTQEPVLLGAALPPEWDDLLGFSITRETLDAGGDVVERKTLRGMKRFEDKDRGLPPGSLVSFDEHPLQSFVWGDYGATPDTAYRYTVTPVHGSPKLLDHRTDAATSVEIRTEPEVQPDRGDGAVRHDIHFNRGVIGSQAYAREFGNAEPQPLEPESEPMRWLSRGLYEAMLAFISQASSDRFALRAAVYEFHYLPVAKAFATARAAGTDVKIVFDAESSYGPDNVSTLWEADLFDDDVAIARTVTDGIRHNKFIVLLKDEAPIAVWTGSTNFSDGGIFGHSNVGHVVWDPTIAASYLEYWEHLAANRTPSELRPLNTAATPTPGGRPDTGVTVLFSPRDAATLDWYAERLDDAERVSCMTLAFDLAPAFRDVLRRQTDVLRYLVKDDPLGADEDIGTDPDVLFAAGGRFTNGAIENFLAERTNPLNSNDYIHTKFMLVDPLGDDPLVITGSANFSPSSQSKNDENMLVIRGDTRVADIYFGEFMRIFDHHYSRHIVSRLSRADRSERRRGYLAASAADWLPAHFNPRSYKPKRRKYFVGR